MIRTLQILTGGFDQNFSYIVWDEKSSAGCLIDPCGDFEKIVCEVEKLSPPPKIEAILLTHSHRDHVSALEDAKRYFGVEKVCGHHKNPFVGTGLNDGEKIFFGENFLTVIATPGHTEDSLSYLASDHSGIFTGDTLFVDYCGFAQDKEALFHSLHERLFVLPDGIQLYSGHDYGRDPFRTLGEEKRLNPYFNAPTQEAFYEALEHLE